MDHAGWVRDHDADARLERGAENLYVAYVARYDQVYGQLGAVVVLMLWLYLTVYLTVYLTGLTVFIGVEMNAALARVAEEKKGIELVQTEDEAEI